MYWHEENKTVFQFIVFCLIIGSMIWTCTSTIYESLFFISSITVILCLPFHFFLLSLFLLHSQKSSYFLTYIPTSFIFLNIFKSFFSPKFSPVSYFLPYLFILYCTFFSRFTFLTFLDNFQPTLVNVNVYSVCFIHCKKCCHSPDIVFQ